jgi:ubiquinone/menaquinone biosynthesis C-methylase UbiE
MSTTEVRHPLFSRFWVLLVRLLERDLGERRDELLAGLSGRVVEIGAGTGINFRHYPETVDEVVALEPEPYLRGKAVEAAGQAPVRVSVRDGVADPLPADDASFDAAVVSLVLCSVPDPAGAMAELRRVLKPGGEIRFLEHVRSERPRMARVQQWLDRTGIWPRVGGGCHCSRQTVATIASAGFRIDRVHNFDFGPFFDPTRPHAIGTARAPAETTP